MSLPVWCRAAPDGTFLEIVVQPRASREGVGPVQGDRLKVRIHAPPVDDAANEALVRLLAETLGVPRAAVTLAAGRTGRRKTVKIAGVGAELVAARLAGP
ncbi:MAG: YggU family protein [Myxococcales bacterium]|nr:YggU family protein [Myxococcales bacterium]